VDGYGIRGNLRFVLPLNDFQKKVLWSATEKPDTYALSHNADGKGLTEAGVFVVREITQVRSVDLVDNAATTRSLFESKNMSNKTLKEALETGKGPLPLRAKLLEIGEGLPILEAKMCEEDETDIHGHLANAVAAGAKSGDPDHHELATKIMKLLKPEGVEEEEEPAGTGEKPKKDEDNPAAKNPKEDEPDKSAAKESKTPRKAAPGVTRLTEATCKSLCESAGITPSGGTLAALKQLDVEGAAALLAEMKKLQGPQRPSGPRSQLARGLTESRSDKPFDAKEYAASLRR
jgi:hypothetical protein